MFWNHLVKCIYLNIVMLKRIYQSVFCVFIALCQCLTEYWNVSYQMNSDSSQWLSSLSCSTLPLISSWHWRQKAPEVLDMPEINLSDLSLCLCCCCSLVTVDCVANRWKCVCLTCSAVWICFSLLLTQAQREDKRQGMQFYLCLSGGFILQSISCQFSTVLWSPI